VVQSVVLTVLGAVLYYAVTAEVTGVDINAVGGILMVAGIALALFGLLSGITAAVKDRTTRVHHVDERPSP
jgi:hypothetical protein